MAKNFVEEGKTVAIVASAAISSGDLVQVGDVFAVALTDIPQGETGDGMTEGVFMLPKLKTDDMKTGKKVYLKSGKVQLTHIFHLIQVCLQTVPILHRQIFRLVSWLFSTVMSHRGISLKIIGVKRFMTWLPATRYLFLNSAHYRKMSPGYPRKGSFRSGTAHPG